MPENRPFTPYPFDFIERTCRPRAFLDNENHPVVIVGGGIAGLTLALGLARQNIATLVIEADRTVCYGSRAVCFSRRSLEIYDRLGVADRIMQVALPWTGGRSSYRNHEVLHFLMPHDDHQKFAPMVNMQQYHLEQILVDALESLPELVDIRWGSKVVSVEPDAGAVHLAIEESGAETSREYRITADWVAACDGGRSFVRESLGLQMKGAAYEGRYVVVDLAVKLSLPTERLAWFDPPSNPGSTILMHRQPDDVWRIDYQLRDGEDPDEAIKPANVFPLITAHLAMIGVMAPWTPIWISIYRANALSLDAYRHGRIVFCGDAAHLVPIFGVRGANSTIDDTDNLAWKLARVMKGGDSEALLDSYSSERRHAATVNLEAGMKSTEFMAPPTPAFRAMRDAVLNLAVDHAALKPLINPRQTTPVSYPNSSLNVLTDEPLFNAGPAPGMVLPCFPVVLTDPDGASVATYTSALVECGCHLILAFSSSMKASTFDPDHEGVRILPVVFAPSSGHRAPVLVDATRRVFEAFDAMTDATYLIRPDGHVLGRWRGSGWAQVSRVLAIAQRTLQVLEEVS